jgi:hypothetical protein
MQGENADYAVLGSSRVLNMIDIHTLDQAYGKKGINLATSGSGYGENYLILSKFIERNTISELFLNTDEFCFNSVRSYNYPFHEYEFLNQFPYPYYRPIFDDFLPAWKCLLWDLIPFSKFCEFNDLFTFSKSNDLAQVYSTTGGSILLGDSLSERKLSLHKYSQTELDNRDKKYFIKILALCHSRKIKITLITTPLYCGDHHKVNPEFENYIQHITDSAKIRYITFNDLIDCRDSTFFKDNTHTNSKGSIEYSKNLGQILKAQ